MRFTATFKEVRLVKTATTQITVAVEPKAKKKAKKGKKVAKTTDDSTANKSWLTQGTDRADNAFGGVYDALELGTVPLGI